MVAATAFSARSGWSVCSEIRWSVSRGTGGQFAPESRGQYQRILHFEQLIFGTTLLWAIALKTWL